MKRKMRWRGGSKPHPQNQVVQWVLQDLQIKYLTVFALSRDNVSSRSEEELRVRFPALPHFYSGES